MLDIASLSQRLEKKRMSKPAHPTRVVLHLRHRQAQKIAEENGFLPTRTVIHMVRSLEEHLPDISAPEGLRSFLPGLDNQEWLSLNNQIFAEHPEQGHWNCADLDDRLSQPWFDPNGFLLATHDGKITAYCWTKIHGEVGHHGIGEIYVAAVSPDFRGLDLGRAIVVAGLAYLRRKELREAMLYVDEDNHAAISLYKSIGFTEAGRDVLYQLSID